MAGRKGRVVTDDGTLDIELVTPGGADKGANPEAMFAAGYASCLSSSVFGLARRRKLETGPVAVTVKVSLGPSADIWGLAIQIRMSFPELPRDVAQTLLDDAHRICPYSNALRGNVEVDVALA